MLEKRSREAGAAKALLGLGAGLLGALENL